MSRYLTKRYVAVSRAEAKRLAALDGTRVDQIRYTPRVKVLHRTEWWAWWSDQTITSALTLPSTLNPTCLSATAEKLINQVRNRRPARPRCGWSTLANIKQIVSCDTLALRSYQDSNWEKAWTERIEQLQVKYTNATVGTLYTFFSSKGLSDLLPCYEIGWEFPVERLLNLDVITNISIETGAVVVEFESCCPLKFTAAEAQVLIAYLTKMTPLHLPRQLYQSQQLPQTA